MKELFVVIAVLIVSFLPVMNTHEQINFEKLLLRMTTFIG